MFVCCRTPPNHDWQACPDVDGPRTAVLASQEHETRTVALVLDATSVRWNLEP
jgi:hypothetical protein